MLIVISVIHILILVRARDMTSYMNMYDVKCSTWLLFLLSIKTESITNLAIKRCKTVSHQNTLPTSAVIIDDH